MMSVLFSILNIRLNIYSFSVALTACVNPRKQFSSGETIKFTDIRTNIGITNISSFQSTGQFVCTVSDLYHISVMLTSKSKYHFFQIYINNNLKVNGWIDDYYMSDSSVQYWNSAAAVTATWLKVGDIVKVTSSLTAMIGESKTSCLTIIRLT